MIDDTAAIVTCLFTFIQGTEFATYCIGSSRYYIYINGFIPVDTRVWHREPQKSALRRHLATIL